MYVRCKCFIVEHTAFGTFQCKFHKHQGDMSKLKVKLLKTGNYLSRTYSPVLCPHSHWPPCWHVISPASP